MIMMQEEVPVIKKLISLENLDTFKRLLYEDIDIHNIAKIEDINSAISNLSGGVLTSGLNTIKKITDAIGNDPNFSETINAILDTKTSFDDVYTKAEIDEFNIAFEYIDNSQIDDLFNLQQQ